MAENTSKEYRNQVMYSVYVRNHSEEGTFEGVRRDLERIHALGVDIIWLMPIHPIGAKGHKGSKGCPYAIKDYRGINPEYGTLDDFKALVDDIHCLGMKCIIDVVYNHTSPDSVLVEEHPEWFYRMPDGSMGNHVGEWSDVVDLDYGNEVLWDYQIETLKMWAGIVDGFRCDVASLVPVGFWLRARKEVEEVRPGCIWLAESVEPEFISICRKQGIAAHTDSEIFRAFDIAYDYDIFPQFQQYLNGSIPLERYIEALNRQEWIYPDNYIKLRFLENHDQLRAAFAIPDETARMNWTAFIYYIKGLTLIYGGQENSADHFTSLFDRDVVDYSGKSIKTLMKQLYEIKKDPLFAEGTFIAEVKDNDVVYAKYTATDGRKMVGVFGLCGRSALISADIEDGCYINLINHKAIDVKFGKLSFTGEPIIFKADK